MCSQTTKQAKPADHSLTDQILTFCASGHFGVREAIAAATHEASAAGDETVAQTDAGHQAETTTPTHLASSIAPQVDEEATQQP